MTATTSFKEARLGKNSKSQGTGSKAELLFFEEAEKRGFEVMSPAYGSDTGIDFHVTSKTSPDPDKRRVYNVQVTSCTENDPGYYGDGTGPSWRVAKPIEKIREDVDIIAILIRNYNSGEETNINTGIAGKQDIWFILRTKTVLKPYGRR